MAPVVVEVVGTPVDIDAEPAGATTTVVQATPLAKQLTQTGRRRFNGMVTGPDAEAEQKSHANLILTMFLSAVVPMIVLSYYYRDGWGDLYCETDIAEWALVFGWARCGVSVYEYVCNVWFFLCLVFFSSKTKSDVKSIIIAKRQSKL